MPLQPVLFYFPHIHSSGFHSARRANTAAGAMVWIFVGVFIELALIWIIRAVVMHVLQRAGDRAAFAALHVIHRAVDAVIGAVGFRRRRHKHNRIRQGNPRFR